MGEGGRGKRCREPVSLEFYVLSLSPSLSDGVPISNGANETGKEEGVGRKEREREREGGGEGDR